MVGLLPCESVTWQLQASDFSGAHSIQPSSPVLDNPGECCLGGHGAQEFGFELTQLGVGLSCALCLAVSEGDIKRCMGLAPLSTA